MQDNPLFSTPEDLIILKLLSGRPQDLLDAVQIRETQKDSLDTAYIQTWCDKLGAALTPEPEH